nr:type VI secretion system baseplate subunit TssG [Roseibaca domitiana]
MRQRIESDCASLDVLALMRQFERAYPDLPRIGQAATLAQEIVFPRQEPFMAFPGCNVTRVDLNANGPHDVHVRFMGYFGPQGALPLALTAEAQQWMQRHDDPSFARFADIFAMRFVQLFYRAWADARPVVQADRPADDRFRRWLGALTGIGTPALQDRDSLPDSVRLGLTGLLSGRVRSATRLRQCLGHIVEMPFDLEEHVGTWLEFEDEDRTRLGSAASRLGQDTCLGARSYSLSDKLRLTLHCDSLQTYRAHLPGRAAHRRLADFLKSWLGVTTEVEIALSLPFELVPPTVLGRAGDLGWTSFTPAAATEPAPDNPVPRRRVCAAFSAF